MMETCPYCKKVMNFMDENKIDYKKLNTNDNENALKLLHLGGKDQVPFLYDLKNNKGLYESDEIIEYLQNHLAKDNKNE